LRRFFEVGFVTVEFQPVVQHAGFVFRVLVALISFRPGGDVALFTLSNSANTPSSPLCSSSNSVERAVTPSQFGEELVDGCLLLGKVAGDNESLGD